MINNDVASWPPDTVWAYSNAAICLLQKVIEAVSGVSFAEYSKGFLQSMGMTSSSFYLNDHPAGTRISRNYLLGTEVPTPQINIPPTGASGGLDLIMDAQNYLPSSTAPVTLYMKSDVDRIAALKRSIEFRRRNRSGKELARRAGDPVFGT